MDYYAQPYINGSTDDERRAIPLRVGRPKKASDLLAIVQVAKLFYEDDLAPGKIAKRLGVDRRTVKRILEDARNSGVVTVEIDGRVVPPPARHPRRRQLAIPFA
jgi:transcriptional regulator GlxA family with amidase domain